MRNHWQLKGTGQLLFNSQVAWKKNKKTNQLTNQSVRISNEPITVKFTT